MYLNYELTFHNSHFSFQNWEFISHKSDFYIFFSYISDFLVITSSQNFELSQFFIFFSQIHSQNEYFSN